MIDGDPTIYYTRDDWLAIDVETTGHYRDKEARLLCICWTDSKGRRGRYVGGELLPPRVYRKIATAGFLVAHNAAFECGWLKRCGLDLRKLTFWCTFNAEWLLRAGLPSEVGALSLAGVCKRRSVGVKMEYPTICIHKGLVEELPTDVLTEYCLLDAALCGQLFLRQREDLLLGKSVTKLQHNCSESKALKQKLLLSEELKGTLVPLQYQRSMLTPVLADIMSNGLQLDQELVTECFNEATLRKEKLEQELYALTKGINLGSNKQKAEYVYDTLGFTCTATTAGGSRSTKDDVLRSLVPVTEDQRKFLSLYFDYNDTRNLLSKYLILFKAVVEENDGLLFGELNQGRTVTHRLSSSGVPFKSGQFKSAKSVQFQNIPRDLKKLFVAKKKGRLTAECDGSQLEFRVGGDLSGDSVISQEISDLSDVHALTASVLKVSRQEAKPHTFAPMYGGNGKTKEERAYCRAFRKKYKTLHDMQQRWCLEVVADSDKKLRLPYGMVYQFPNTRMQSDGYISGSTNIYNYGIQGFATAEIIPIALAYMWHHLPEGVEIVNTVHDSIVCEVEPDALDAYQNLSIEAMTTGVYEFLERVYGYTFKVPLGVGIKVGERWGSGDERTFQNEGGTVYEIVKNEKGKKVKVVYQSNEGVLNG